MFTNKIGGGSQILGNNVCCSIMRPPATLIDWICIIPLPFRGKIINLKSLEDTPCRPPCPPLCPTPKPFVYAKSNNITNYFQYTFKMLVYCVYWDGIPSRGTQIQNRWDGSHFLPPQTLTNHQPPIHPTLLSTPTETLRTPWGYRALRKIGPN